MNEIICALVGALQLLHHRVYNKEREREKERGRAFNENKKN